MIIISLSADLAGQNPFLESAPQESSKNQILDDEQKLKVISSALRSSLFLAVTHNVNIVNTAVLSGGWRLEIEQAFKQMVQTFLVIKSTSFKVPRLNICVLTSNEFIRIKNTLTEIKVNYEEKDNSIII